MPLLKCFPYYTCTLYHYVCVYGLNNLFGYFPLSCYGNTLIRKMQIICFHDFYFIILSHVFTVLIDIIAFLVAKKHALYLHLALMYYNCYAFIWHSFSYVYYAFALIT